MCIAPEGPFSGATAYDGGHNPITTHNHRHHAPHLHSVPGGHQPMSHHHSNVMYATMRPNPRQPTLNSSGPVCFGSAQDSSFHEFVPPPPPMFENGGGASCTTNNQLVSAILHNNETDFKKTQKVSSKSGGGRPAVAPKPKIEGKNIEKGKEKKKKQESTV